MAANLASEITNLFYTEISVSSSDGLSEIVRQWIEHGMMRVNAGKSVFIELLGDDGHEFLHPSLVIGPVANDLQTMGEVAISIWEIWLQLEGCPVGLNGLGDVA